MQKLGSGVPFKKEVYLQSLTPYIQANMDTVAQFLDRLSVRGFRLFVFFVCGALYAVVLFTAGLLLLYLFSIAPSDSRVPSLASPIEPDVAAAARCAAAGGCVCRAEDRCAGGAASLLQYDRQQHSLRAGGTHSSTLSVFSRVAER